MSSSKDSKKRPAKKSHSKKHSAKKPQTVEPQTEEPQTVEPQTEEPQADIISDDSVYQDKHIEVSQYENLGELMELGQRNIVQTKNGIPYTLPPSKEGMHLNFLDIDVLQDGANYEIIKSENVDRIKFSYQLMYGLSISLLVNVGLDICNKLDLTYIIVKTSFAIILTIVALLLSFTIKDENNKKIKLKAYNSVCDKIEKRKLELDIKRGDKPE